MNAKLTLTAAVAVTGLPLLQPALLPAARSAVLADALYSRMPGFTFFQLPDNGARITDAELVKALTEPLKSFAKDSGMALRATEVVQWPGADGDPRNMLQSTLQGAGYEYKALGDKKTDDATMYIFTATQSGGSTVAGYWIDRKGQLILVWGSGGPKDAAEKAKPGGDKPVVPVEEKAAPEKPGKKVSVPSSLVGPTWSWTTIGGVNYVDQKGTMMEPSGMSASYTFTPDGRYKFFFYVRQRTYSLVTESTTNHSGKVTFADNNTFTVYPEKGTYKGHTGSRIIDRPMTESERKPVTWYYEWRTENGKRVLYIGPNKSSARPFKQG
jgi:hypothetical protein